MNNFNAHGKPAVIGLAIVAAMILIASVVLFMQSGTDNEAAVSLSNTGTKDVLIDRTSVKTGGGQQWLVSFLDKKDHSASVKEYIASFSGAKIVYSYTKVMNGFAVSGLTEDQVKKMSDGLGAKYTSDLVVPGQYKNIPATTDGRLSSVLYAIEVVGSIKPGTKTEPVKLDSGATGELNFNKDVYPSYYPGGTKLETGEL